MNNDLLGGLDQAELLALALDASQRDQHADALACYKELAGRADAPAQAHFGMGAMLAQLRLYERAIESYQRALAADPALHPARVQLALLLIGQARTQEAAETVQPLAALADGAYRHFGAGLQALCEDRLADAARELNQGIAIGSGNPPLDGDLAKLAAAAAEAAGKAGDGAAAAQPEAEAEADLAGSHLLLSAYSQLTRH